MRNSRLLTVWDLMQPVSGLLFASIAATYGPAFATLAKNHGLSRRELAHFAYVVANFDPNHLSVQEYRRRSPYDHPRSVASYLEAWLRSGLIVRVGQGTFAVSTKGRTVWLSRWELANGLLSEVHPIEERELAQLLILLDRVVESVVRVSQPNALLALSTRLAYGMKANHPASPLWRLYGRWMDLLAFRDDAHLASWQNRYDLSGHAWEAFTLLWTGAGDNAETIAQLLAYRGEGYEAGDYATALEDLAARGWVMRAVEPGQYHVSDAGQILRAGAEDFTNKTFFAPWACLKRREIEIVAHILHHLAEALTH